MHPYVFRLLADYNQFYLEDELAEGVVSWEEDERDLLSLAPGIIAVATNCARVVSVEVEVSILEPPADFERWDHVVECGIHIPSGRLVVIGCCEDYQKAARIELEPKNYRARICYGNQYSCDDGLTCSDHYTVRLWPSKNKSVQVIKRRVDLFSSQIS